jgi:hypothetical protein
MQRGQLEPEEFYSTHPSKIFSGMNVCLGDLIDEDRHLLVAFVEEFGGQWSEELRPTTTHLVMMRGQGPLYEQALLTSTTGQSDIRIVLPHFFEDCVKLRRLVPDEEYRFPEPALLRTDVDRTTATLQRSAALRGEQPVASAVLTPKPADKPFLDPKRHVFYIDPHSRIQAAVVTEYSRLLKLAGGTVVNSYDCDCVSHVICNLQGTFCYKQVRV